MLTQLFVLPTILWWISLKKNTARDKLLCVFMYSFITNGLESITDVWQKSPIKMKKKKKMCCMFLWSLINESLLKIFSVSEHSFSSHIPSTCERNLYEDLPNLPNYTSALLTLHFFWNTSIIIGVKLSLFTILWIWPSKSSIYKKGSGPPPLIT